MNANCAESRVFLSTAESMLKSMHVSICHCGGSWVEVKKRELHTYDKYNKFDRQLCIILQQANTLLYHLLFTNRIRSGIVDDSDPALEKKTTSSIVIFIEKREGGQ